jgi:hypothetical protein
MRRLLLTAGIALAALAGGSSAAAQTTPTTPAPTPIPATPLRATLDSCQTALTATDRSAVFSGSMPPVARTWRMRMRFDLYSRRGSAAKWQRLAAPKWGVWHASRARVPGFVFTKVVDGLDAPASYRALVRFRWYDKQGEIVRTAHRTTPACVQPDPRPDLRLSSLTAIAVSSSVARYTVVVRNAGLGVAGPFGIVLTIGDRRTPISIGAGLTSGQQRAVTIDAPSCLVAGKLTILLDSADTVDEAGGRDAPIARACPL